MAERDPEQAAVKTVAKVLDILEHLRAVGRPRTVSEISRATGINISTAHRLLQTLAHRHYVEQAADTHAYGLGPRLLELGCAYAGSVDMVDAARPRMERLRDNTGETVHLTILVERDAVEICHAAGRQPVSALRGGPGRRDPAHLVATGKVLLAALPPGRLDALLKAGPLAGPTRCSITDPDALRRDLERTRGRGYALDEQELVDDVCCVAVPVRDGAGRIAASLGIAIPLARFKPENISAWVRLLGNAAEGIASTLTLSPAR